MSCEHTPPVDQDFGPTPAEVKESITKVRVYTVGKTPLEEVQKFYRPGGADFMVQSLLII